MIPLSCYIVDNEEYAISHLVKYIRNTPGLALTGSETNPVAALGKINSGTVRADVTFLDIDMPQLSGLELAQMIQSYTNVVFTTAHEEFALKAFDTEVIDYLLKPISYPRFLKAIQKIQKIAGEQSAGNKDKDVIYVQSQAKGKIIRIRIADIQYVEAAQNYVRIVITENSHLTYLTMKEMEHILPSGNFLRVHKSFLVSMDRIASVEGGMIHLDSGHAVPLGPGYRKDFSDRINARVIRSKR